MSLEEHVSDWELEEIWQELRAGEAPDVVAFRHGVPVEVMPRKKPSKGVQDHSSYRTWTDAEKAFVMDNYPSHGTRNWRGWTFLDRSWPSIEWMAHNLGVTKKQRERPWTKEEIGFVVDNYPAHGKKWEGWKMLDRTWVAIRWRAHLLGVKKRVRDVNEGWRRTNGALVRPRKVQR